jgi:hypothetical protein
METHNITWRNIDIEISFTPEECGMVDQIELRTNPRLPLPVTETDYKSHFIPAGTGEAHGGAVSFVTAWLNHEEMRTGWNGAQMSLF